MTGKYDYKGIDVTIDVYDKIRSVVEILAEEAGSSFDDELSSFMQSRTYVALADPRTLMWSESPRFIADELHRERGA